MIYVTLVNLVWICFLIWKLRSIKKDPHKYDKIPNYDNYRGSSWYWPPKKSYNKGDPPEYAGRYCVPFLLAAAMYYYASTVGIYVLSAQNDSYAIRFYDIGGWSGFTILLYMAYALLLSFYCPLFFKSPIAISFCTFTLFPKRARSDKWAIMTRTVLIATILLLPFRLLALNNNGCANSEEIVYRPYGSFVEQHFVYDEVKEIRVVMKEERVLDCWLVNSEGRQFDLSGQYCNGDEPEKRVAMEQFVRLLPEGLKDRINKKIQEAQESPKGSGA